MFVYPHQQGDQIVSRLRREQNEFSGLNPIEDIKEKSGYES